VTRSRRPTREQLEGARDKTIPDVIAPGLIVVFCGINPSLYSAAVGCHFARPGNRFWPTIHRAGFTSRVLSPFEQWQLLDAGCGITNVVDRATASADELAVDELIDGSRRLERKIRRFGPRCVAFLGITAYRTAFRRKHATIGPQLETIADSRIFVLPNPSGLNAHYQLPALARMFRQLREEIETQASR
jgi:TDG/mug DNA glycosylase family protein